MAKEKEIKELLTHVNRLLKLSTSLIGITILAMVLYSIDPNYLAFDTPSDTIATIPVPEDRDRIVDGIHLRTGLIDAEGLFVVISNCTNCHSAKLVTQNRMNTQRWNETIKWMQETQNLWDLGENQEIIVNYLVSNYPPKKSNGRRTNLTEIDWYEQED